ncbi:MAG: hypothetical protein LBI13_03635, partial [Streptococcaceae bacterium]|nr:hypothetical protein [Streptococcaceae bacterium]
MLSFTQSISASSTLPAKQLTVTKPATISPLTYATNQLVQQVLSTPVVNTAQKAADLSQSTGTTVSTPATVVVNP